MRDAHPEVVRASAAIDTLRVLVARARFQALARSARLRDCEDLDFKDSTWQALCVNRRLLRFWEGMDAARPEIQKSGPPLPEHLREAFDDAVGVTASAMEEWAGTPVAAVARSGALWDYKFYGGSRHRLEGGKVEKVTEESPAPTGFPSSGSDGTGTGE